MLGNAEAPADDVAKATDLMVSLGGVQKTADLALDHVNAALPELDAIPETPYRELLAEWARYMIEREF